MEHVFKFPEERARDQLQSPATLAKSIPIKAGVLLECYQWSDGGDPSTVEVELADVLNYCLLMTNKLGLNPGEIAKRKLAIGVLLARVEARLRASQRERRVVTYGGLRMDTVIMKGFWRDQDLMLTHNEYILLLLLVQSGSRPVSKEILNERIWGSLPEQDHGDMYSTVFRLNKKLEAAEADLRIVSRRMAGYALEEI